MVIFLVVLKLGTSSFLQFLGCLIQPSSDVLVAVIPEPFINGFDSFGHLLQVINGPCDWLLLPGGFVQFLSRP